MKKNTGYESCILRTLCNKPEGFITYNHIIEFKTEIPELFEIKFTC